MPRQDDPSAAENSLWYQRSKGAHAASVEHLGSYPRKSSRPTLARPKQRLVPNGGLQFSHTRQNFNLQGPILTQAVVNQKEIFRSRMGRPMDGQSRIKVEPSSKAKEEKSQLSKFDGTSQGVSLLNVNQPDFISSFDVNDHSDQQQPSILAISQAHDLAPSQKDSSISQTRNRGRSGHRSIQKSRTHHQADQNKHISGQRMNKKHQMVIGKSQKAVSNYSLSSKHSGCSPLTPLREQKIQARFIG